MRKHGLYTEELNGVNFLTSTVFRAATRLPAQVPVGYYTVDVKLFAKGNLIAHSDSAFEIVEVGFEQFVVDTAREHGLLYGFATALMALVGSRASRSDGIELQSGQTPFGSDGIEAAFEGQA